MTTNKISLQTLLIISSLFMPFSLQAMNSYLGTEPEFVFATFATHRSRASLLDKANELGIRSYIVNWQSKVDLKNNCIRNVQMRANGKWFRLKKVPLPHVVYDFGVYKGARKRKEKANYLKQQLRDLGIPFINPENAMDAVNNKFQFARLMSKNQVPHPATLNLKTNFTEFLKYRKSNLKRMLDSHDLLFLKPSLGSKGYGIIIVENTGDDLFSVRYKTRDEKNKKKWNSIQSFDLAKNDVPTVVAQARKELRTSKAPYIIQQGINVFHYEGQQTDFRVNIQRGGDGTLSSTGLMMRVGGNLSQGGRPAGYRFVLKSFGDDSEIELIKDQVIEVALNTHRALEKAAGSVIGDLGMDVVIDDNANPYIIEANTKSGYPSTYVRKNPALESLYGLPPALELCEEKDSKHEENLIDYARYLAAQAALDRVPSQD